jgi:hypothetical protein
VAFSKDEETCSGSLIETDPENNKAVGGELFMYSHEFGQFLRAGWTPCGPKVEEDEFPSEGGGIKGLARGEVGEGKRWGKMKKGWGRTTGCQSKDKDGKEEISKKRKSHQKE